MAPGAAQKASRLAFYCRNQRQCSPLLPRVPKASPLSLIVFRHPSSFPDTCPQAQNKQANPSVIIGITMARDPYLTWNLGMHDHSRERGRISGAELPSMEGIVCSKEIHNSLVVILRIRHSPTFGSYEYSADPPRSPSPQPMQQIYPDSYNDRME